MSTGVDKPSMPMPLTDIEAMEYLQLQAEQEGEQMPVTIRTKEKCPVCKKPFEHVKKLGFICKDHKTTPKRFFVDVYFASSQVKVYSHKSGSVLDSYGLASETQKHIAYELRTHTFDPSKYVKGDIQKYLFQNLFIQWIEIKKSDGISTIYKYEQFNRDYFTFFTGKDIREIRTAQIHNFYHQIKKTLSNKTKKNILDCLHSFFTWLLQMEHTEKIPVFPKVSTEQPDWKWLDVDVQAGVLLAIPEGDRDLYLFLALHGCRPSEGRALKVKNLDFQRESIRITRQFAGRCGNVLVEHTKTKRMREIPMNEAMIWKLKELCRDKLPDAFLFTNPRTGRPYAKTTYQEIWDAARIAKGVNVKAYEGLRHSFASQRVSRGVDIYLISKILGHTDIRTTERYSHTNLEALKQVMTIPGLAPENIRAIKD